MMRFFHYFLVLNYGTSGKFALGFSPLEARSMTADVLISSGVEFTSSSSTAASAFSSSQSSASASSPDVSSVLATLTSFPREHGLNQIVHALDVTGGPEQPDAVTRDQNNNLQLYWTSPITSNYCNFIVQASVKTSSGIVPVRQRIPFPLMESSLPQDVIDGGYLKITEIANQNRDIQQLADNILLASKTYGDDIDLYHVVFAIADWVNTNIRYDTTAMMFPQSKKNSICRSAAVVLESRSGKCDELSALFISLNRALGIPARFVTGQAYTNLPLNNGKDENDPGKNWGAHAWAEVYFPTVGWVPFDVTYGEFGRLSAGHITLSTSHDAADNTNVHYHAKGYDFTIQPKHIDISVIPKELFTNDQYHQSQQEQHQQKPVQLSLGPVEQNVSVGEIVELICSLKNENDFYVCPRLDLANTQDTVLLNECPKHVLLNPNETREFLYRFQVSKDLESGYSYEFPFSIACGAEEARANVFVKDTNNKQEQQVHDMAMQWANPAMSREEGPPPYRRRRPQYYDPSQGPPRPGDKVHNPGDWTRENDKTMFQKNQPRQPSPDDWNRSNSDSGRTNSRYGDQGSINDQQRPRQQQQQQQQEQGGNYNSSQGQQQQGRYWDQQRDSGRQQEFTQQQQQSRYWDQQRDFTQQQQQERQDYSTTSDSPNKSERDWHENWRERKDAESSETTGWWTKDDNKKKQGGPIVQNFNSAAEYRKDTGGWSAAAPREANQQQGRFNDGRFGTNKYHDQTGGYSNDRGQQGQQQQGRYYDTNNVAPSNNNGSWSGGRVMPNNGGFGGWQRNDLLGRSKERYDRQQAGAYYDPSNKYANNWADPQGGGQYQQQGGQYQQRGQYYDSNSRYPTNGNWQGENAWRGDRDRPSNGAWQRNDLLGRSKERYIRDHVSPPPPQFGYDPYGPQNYGYGSYNRAGYGNNQWRDFESFQPKKDWWDKTSDS